MTTPNNDLRTLAREFRLALEARLTDASMWEYRLPSKDEVATFCRAYLDALFPLYFAKEEVSSPDAAGFLAQLDLQLAEQIVYAMRFDLNCCGKPVPANLSESASQLVQALHAKLPRLAQLLGTDLQAALKNDPAASGYEEILLSYPGVEAITVQRLAHELYLLKIPYLPRMMTEVGHSRTGIDIHPGATIGESFFIDHGTGVVIGETATVGNHVTLYHGVTLGAFNPTSRRNGAELVRGLENKRHPDIEDNVTIYPGATILGGDTRVGHHSVIGGNVWLTHSVAPYSRVTVKDPELLIRSKTQDSDKDWFLGSAI
ncbi:MAG TPA: serine O-acetyltransferase [Candidatus Sulfotelmatobacter sp.]|jgi:serine O-acetyltransferase|nr:serine O-acetyltransferase [Candidatus Sulfotelmatobacter sp.]